MSKNNNLIQYAVFFVIIIILSSYLYTKHLLSKNNFFLIVIICTIILFFTYNNLTYKEGNISSDTNDLNFNPSNTSVMIGGDEDGITMGSFSLSIADICDNIDYWDNINELFSDISTIIYENYIQNLQEDANGNNNIDLKLSYINYVYLSLINNGITGEYPDNFDTTRQESIDKFIDAIPDLSYITNTGSPREPITLRNGSTDNSFPIFSINMSYLVINKVGFQPYIDNVKNLNNTIYNAYIENSMNILSSPQINQNYSSDLISSDLISISGDILCRSLIPGLINMMVYNITSNSDFELDNFISDCERFLSHLNPPIDNDPDIRSKLIDAVSGIYATLYNIKQCKLKFDEIYNNYSDIILNIINSNSYIQNESSISNIMQSDIDQMGSSTGITSPATIEDSYNNAISEYQNSITNPNCNIGQYTGTSYITYNNSLNYISNDNSWKWGNNAYHTLDSFIDDPALKQSFLFNQSSDLPEISFNYGSNREITGSSILCCKNQCDIDNDCDLFSFKSENNTCNLINLNKNIGNPMNLLNKSTKCYIGVHKDGDVDIHYIPPIDKITIDFTPSVDNIESFEVTDAPAYFNRTLSKENLFKDNWRNPNNPRPYLRVYDYILLQYKEEDDDDDDANNDNIKLAIIKNPNLRSTNIIPITGIGYRVSDGTVIYSVYEGQTAISNNKSTLSDPAIDGTGNNDAGSSFSQADYLNYLYGHYTLNIYYQPVTTDNTNNDPKTEYLVTNNIINSVEVGRMKVIDFITFIFLQYSFIGSPTFPDSFNYTYYNINENRHMSTGHDMNMIFGHDPAEGIPKIAIFEFKPVTELTIQNSTSTDFDIQSDPSNQLIANITYNNDKKIKLLNYAIIPPYFLTSLLNNRIIFDLYIKNSDLGYYRTKQRIFEDISFTNLYRFNDALYMKNINVTNYYLKSDIDRKNFAISDDGDIDQEISFPNSWYQFDTVVYVNINHYNSDISAINNSNNIALSNKKNEPCIGGYNYGKYKYTGEDCGGLQTLDNHIDALDYDLNNEMSFSKCKNICDMIDDCKGFTHTPQQGNGGRNCYPTSTPRDACGPPHHHHFKYYEKDNSTTMYNDDIYFQDPDNYTYGSYVGTNTGSYDRHTNSVTYVKDKYDNNDNLPQN